jgi:replicative DNA helicase
MRPERLFRKIIQATYKVDNVTLEYVLDAKTIYDNAPLYFGHSYKFKSPDELLKNIREAIDRYGLKFVVFDNLHILCRTDRVNELLSQTILAFKLLAEEAEIPIMVIAQPRKREGGSSEIMSAEDVKYSSSIHSDCDQMIILHRNRTVTKAKEIGRGDVDMAAESMDPIMMVRVEAHRYGPGGETLLYYHGAQSRFDQVARNGLKVAEKRHVRY